MSKLWTQAEDDMMREFYPDHTMKDLMQMIGKTECAIYNRSFKLNIKKSQEYLDSEDAYRFRREQTEEQKANRCKKGFEPWNKGLKGVCNGGQKTQFKKGSTPPNYRPIGSTRPAKDGHTEIKINEGLKGWKLLHRVIWERMNGEIPQGMNLVFIDKNKENIKITNLSLYTKSQNMQRNTVHNYPKEIVHLVQLKAALNRQINKRTQHEQPRT